MNKDIDIKKLRLNCYRQSKEAGKFIPASFYFIQVLLQKSVFYPLLPLNSP